MLVTHLQGPHQSVCWLRPKRARHFLGEPGSERRHAQDEQGGRGGAQPGEERKEGQTDRQQTEERLSGGGGGGGGTGGRAPSGTVGRPGWLVAAGRSQNTQELEKQPRVCV